MVFDPECVQGSGVKVEHDWSDVRCPVHGGGGGACAGWGRVNTSTIPNGETRL